jgi:hypothetical protein
VATKGDVGSCFVIDIPKQVKGVPKQYLGVSKRVQSEEVTITDTQL